MGQKAGAHRGLSVIVQARVGDVGIQDGELLLCRGEGGLC